MANKSGEQKPGTGPMKPTYMFVPALVTAVVVSQLLVDSRMWVALAASSAAIPAIAKLDVTDNQDKQTAGARNIFTAKLPCPGSKSDSPGLVMAALSPVSPMARAIRADSRARSKQFPAPN